MKFRILGKNGHKTVSLNRREAIRQRCLICSAWQPKEVTTCIFVTCPLYAFRSGQGKQNPKERNKAIRKYCIKCCDGQLGEVSKCPSNDCPLYHFRKNGIDRISNTMLNYKIEQIEADF